MASLLGADLSRRRFLALTALLPLARPPKKRRLYPSPSLYPASSLYPMGG